METEDIEDGEILEDESNSNDATFQNDTCNKDFPEFNTNYEQKPPRFEVNNYDNFLPHKEKRIHRHESLKRRERPSFPDIPRKRRRMDDDNGFIRGDKLYYEKNNKCNFDDAPMKSYDEEDSDDEMICVLGGSLRDSERRPKSMKKHNMMVAANDMMDSMMYNEAGENEDPRPYNKRSPLRREKFKKDRDRNMSRGPERCQVGMAKRRGRGGGGGGIPRRGKPRDDHDGGYPGKGPRGNDCGGYVHNYNQPRKLEVCKFYLNDCCTKRDKCIYMHGDFPCKYYHTPGLTCHIGKNCKFSHSKLDEIQRAVLKKYADISLKEIDDMQRYYRENCGNATYSAHKEKKEQSQSSANVNQNSRIPSLFEVKVAVPLEFRGKEDGEEGGSTPMPSPQSASQMFDEDENVESHEKKNKHDNVLLEHNDHMGSEETDRKPSSEEDGRRSHHKKRSKKSDDHSDSERRHSDKRKKRSKKEDRKSDKDRKSKHEQNEVQNLYSDLFPELEEPPWDLEDNNEEPVPEPTPALSPTPPPAAIEDQGSPRYEQKEASDALSHLPKKQQELFLRIQQHQKEAETSQNADADEKEDEDYGKQDVNWYSSDEEEESEKTQPENSSPLATILRTIKSNANNVPGDQKLNNQENILNTYLPSETTITRETDPVVVDASQLANIDLSDEVTQLLTSIMKTDTSTTNQQISSYSLPITKEPQPTVSLSTIVTRRPSDDRIYKFDRIPDIDAPKEDVDLRYITANNILSSTSLFANNQESNPNKDIDFRTLPFKPVPIHDAATEIDASITSHPPMEYKLKPLPFIPRVNYAALIDVAKMCPNDPRFKRKLNQANTENIDTTHVLPPFLPQDPRQALPLKTINESRADPRLADPRKIDRYDPRLDTKVVLNPKPDQRPDPRMSESKMPDKEQVRPITDYRDPRLKSCKFPEVPQIPFPMITPIPPPIVPEMAQMPLRKEDPRLRFRANQK